MKVYQLKTRQICLFFIAFLPIIKFFMLPSVIAETAKEDAWLSTIVNVLIDGFTLAVLLTVCKKHNVDFFEVLTDKFGITTAKVVYTLYSIYFLLKAILPICEQKDFVQLTLYSTIPNVINFLPFFVIAFYFSCKHLRVIGRTSDVMWLVTLLGVAFLIGLSIKNVDFGSFLPVGANGVKNVVKASYHSANWYGDAVYFLFFIGNFKLKKKDGRKILLSFFLASTTVLIFTLVFYGTFTSIAFRQKFALTEISKYSSVINNIGRVDYIGIFLVIASNVVALAMPLYFSSYTLGKVFTVKNNRILPFIVTIVAFCIVTFLREYYNTIEKLFIHLLNPMFFIFGNLIPLSLPLIIKKENTLEQS